MKSVHWGTLVALCAPILGQTGPAGTWQASNATQQPWELVLRADGPNRLAGAVSSCASVRRAFEIFDGHVDGNTVTFKCRSGDGQRILSLRGVLNGGEIAFTWDKQVIEGGNRNGTEGMFDDASPRQFTARRVADASDAVTQMADQTLRHPSVSFDRILHAEQEAENWLTYSGNLRGERYSPLTQITPANVKNLELAWVWQAQTQLRFEATALVEGGILYTVQPPNDVVALNAATGRVLWTYSYKPSARARASGGGGSPNRGLAILGGTLFLGTLDAHLIAIDAFSGQPLWNVIVADSMDPACKGKPLCYVITHAPLVVKDKVIVGVGGGEGPIRGFIAAYDAATGKEVWRFYTVPGAGEPGVETWSGESWKTGGAGVWNTGTYDVDLNLTYWGTGNPYPTAMGKEAGGGDARVGDNLYSDSVVALDADTGKLKWHYQFTPHDNMDWDSTEIPVLSDIDWQGRRRKVLLMANRNGILYALDRSTGEFLQGKPFVEVNWMTGFDEKGRPIQVPGLYVNSEKTVVHPANGTNWMPPSFSPSTGLFYVAAWEREAVGGYMRRPSPSYAAMRAIDPRTGEKVWELRKDDVMFPAGALTTASDLLFTGTSGDYYSGDEAARLGDRYFYALNARTGEILWQMALTGSVLSGPISYSVAGKQYVAVAAGNTLFAFALRQ